MDPQRYRRVMEVFEVARGLPAAERGATLDRECGGDDEIRREVESLLRRHEDSGGILGESSVQRLIDIDGLPDAWEILGEAGDALQRVGPYEILERIGEGGMGIVYLAEQEAPVRRQVALKVIQRGMATREVLVRFEAERQALALLSHPGIAEIYDAGSTEDGRPYIAMEYFPGSPITRYCDENRLGLDERLGVFLLVCEGLEHAHRRGIIHRDLKPSNVLVGGLRPSRRRDGGGEGGAGRDQRAARRARASRGAPRPGREPLAELAGDD